MTKQELQGFGVNEADKNLRLAASYDWGVFNCIFRQDYLSLRVKLRVLPT